MNEFQITAASMAILLEVFSEEAERCISLGPDGANRTEQMQKDLKIKQQRVASKDFWHQLGGISELERRIRDGFAEINKYGLPDNEGKLIILPFPPEIEVLFRALQHCNNSAESLIAPARAALPFLRAFTKGNLRP
jgi:hypothetical protein